MELLNPNSESDTLYDINDDNVDHFGPVSDIENFNFDSEMMDDEIIRAVKSLHKESLQDRRPEDSSKPTGRQGNISLDDIPWSKIEYDFSRCLRHLFVDHTDPQLITGWRFTGNIF
ncbi:hypothetical protein ACF0H5_003894 [Mactra antiquata]